MTALAPSPAPPKLDVMEYVLLFRGDDLSDGYATPELAQRICELTFPNDMGELVRIVFGDDVGELTWREKTSLDRGFIRFDTRRALEAQ